MCLCLCCVVDDIYVDVCVLVSLCFEYVCSCFFVLCSTGINVCISCSLFVSKAAQAAFN